MTTTTDLTIRPFEVHVPEEDLADLRRRIAAWRPPALRAALRTPALKETPEGRSHRCAAPLS
jgi:hypothetical protein